MTNSNSLTNVLGNGSNLNVGMPGYGSPQGGNGADWSGAYAAQAAYQNDAYNALNRQAAQIQNPYAVQDTGNSQGDLAAQQYFTQNGIPGQFAGAYGQLAAQSQQGAQGAACGAARSAPAEHSGRPAPCEPRPSATRRLRSSLRRSGASSRS